MLDYTLRNSQETFVSAGGFGQSKKRDRVKKAGYSIHGLASHVKQKRRSEGQSIVREDSKQNVYRQVVRIAQVETGGFPRIGRLSYP